MNNATKLLENRTFIETARFFKVDPTKIKERTFLKRISKDAFDVLLLKAHLSEVLQLQFSKSVDFSKLLMVGDVVRVCREAKTARR